MGVIPDRRRQILTTRQVEAVSDVGCDLWPAGHLPAMPASRESFGALHEMLQLYAAPSPRSAAQECTCLATSVRNVHSWLDVDRPPSFRQ